MENMSRSRICTGELQGCRPTLEQLSEIWSLALKGFDNPDKKILLTHFIKSRERVRQDTLEALAQEAGNPATLDNLTLKANQEIPLREIEIQIGMGRLTSVTVEADDHTWAIGRHTELMERFLKTRKPYAFGSIRVPEWPKSSPKKASTLRSGLEFLASLIFGLPIAAAAFLAVVFLVAVPVHLVNALIHGRHVTNVAALTFPFELVALAGVIVFIMIAFRHSRSAVIIRYEPAVTPLRITMITATTGVVAVIISAVSALRK
ncbi:hypothetical protein [Actinomadura oligospora]|uniref:hypothetical protein n=1 Tax=Actinomadura oligospora TaxID=111804 RepID=UPI0012F73BBD|nr:hypothetical protein [Actinomadura oligospora]